MDGLGEYASVYLMKSIPMTDPPGVPEDSILHIRRIAVFGIIEGKGVVRVHLSANVDGEELSISCSQEGESTAYAALVKAAKDVAIK